MFPFIRSRTPTHLAEAALATLLLSLPVCVMARSPLVDSLDICISNSYEVESSVFVSPLHPDVVIVSNNAPSSTYLSAWISTNGGKTWSNNPVAQGGYDPAVVISANPALSDSGRFFAHYLVLYDKPQYISYKDQPSVSWDDTVRVEDPPTDGGHLWVDNSPHSPPGKRYNLYCGWRDDEPPEEGGRNRIAIERSIAASSGTEWISQHLFAPPAGRSYTSVNIQTGRTGAVYAIWEQRETTTSPGRFVYSMSINGGASWPDQTLLQVPVQTMTWGNCLRRGTQALGAFSNPSMTVDRSDSTGDHLYVVWADCNGPDVHILAGFAEALGDSVAWEDTAQVVNQDLGDNDQWWPWITWDECTGLLAVAFMDSRNFANQAGAETFVAVSPPPYRNGGVYSWTEVKVSDASWSKEGADFYDYIGVASGDGRVFPVWSDDRSASGSFRPFTSPLLLWGVEQDSIEVTPVGNVNDTLTVLATWTTNLRAREDDRLALSSPNGLPYESSLCSTCSDSTGRTHAVTLTVSCEPGWWKYTVSSRRDGCVQVRKSDVDSFFVAPTVVASGTIVSTSPDASFTCPRGDGVSRYVASVDFGCVAQIDSTRLTLEALPMDETNRKMAFFPRDTPQPADGPATSGNGYATTITERQIGGCNGDTASVFLDSIEIARLDVPSTPSVDLNLPSPEGDGFGRRLKSPEDLASATQASLRHLEIGVLGLDILFRDILR